MITKARKIPSYRLHELTGQQLRAVVELQLLSGMRSGEVMSMRTGDLDMTGEVWEYVGCSQFLRW